MKIAADVPAPPPVTPEVRASLEREAREWSEELRKKVRAMEAITPEEWSTRVR